MKLFKHLQRSGVSLLLAALATAAQADEPQKILRTAYRIAETTLDPAKINDVYSYTVTAHIFEGLYKYDHLARPAKIVPLLADGMPVVSEDFRTWTVKVRPGIYFASDPAFKGVRREVVAQDFVYAFQRIADPANKSPGWSSIEANVGFVGLSEVRKAALDRRKPFDYDAPVEGLRALDRHTVQFKLREPRPRLLQNLTGGETLGAQAREVVEHYGDQIDAHPVGTGPFRLKQWRRASLIVLEKNPEFRHEVYDAQPAANDARGQALLQRLKGRKLPMVDEVHISIIEEAQPFWLALLNGQSDIVGGVTGAVPGEYVSQAVPHGQLAPNLAKRGLQFGRQVNADSVLVYFNMEDPVVGGYTPDKVALRRAISLATDLDRMILLGYRGLAIPGQGPSVPHTSDYDPAYKSEMSQYSPARAKALLDLFGYVDKNGDGWRDLPDGSPLVIERGWQPDQTSRVLETLWKRDMDAIHLRTRSVVGNWSEQYKQARAGQLQMWFLGGSADQPDGLGAYARFDGAQSGSQNLARFKNDAFDAMYRKMGSMPDGPERDALFGELKKIATAYMPYKVALHRVSTDMWHPWVIGFKRPVFWYDWYQMVDIDLSQKPAP